jgi:hypothetical protein
MIVNDNYRFLFVHIQKTGGTSITEFLFTINGSRLEGYHHGMYSQPITRYEQYFKFCVVRNPWARLVSWYEMMRRKKVHNDFSAYLLKHANHFSDFLSQTETIFEKNEKEWDGVNPYPKSIAFNQVDYISDGSGRILVDHICRFERLKQEFQEICERFGITSELLHVNRNPNSMDYRSYYSPRNADLVKVMYKKDIETFGYRF